VEISVTAKCESGHEQPVGVQWMSLEAARTWAGLMDGTSPFYVRSPIGDPDTLIGRCGICRGQITCTVAVVEPPPADRSRQTLTDGSPVPEDRSHTNLRPDGQQQGYVVLSDAERGKGFLRPYRDAYRHLKCGKITTMGRRIAETYAICPDFYSGTFCSNCRAHFPVGEAGEFVWYEMDGSIGPKVGT
jgi:hypothetical protein